MFRDCRGAPYSGLVSLVVAVVLSAPAIAAVKLPPTPSWAAATPVRVAPGGSEPLAFSGTIFRIPFSSQIGAAYRIGSDKVLTELRWEKQPGRSREFDVQVNDRLRELGYQVIDATTSAFDSDKQRKTRFQFGAVVTRVQQNYYLKRANYQISDESYGVSELDVEFQLQDAETEQVVFQKSVRGYGIEQAKDPRPIIPAIMNALDHVLADPQLVAKLQLASTPTTNPAATFSTLIIRPCAAAEGRQLPAALDAVNGAVVGIRTGAVRGTAALISPDGWALTAAHVISGRDTVGVRLANGLELDAEVSRVDVKTDVALLRLPGRGHPCISIMQGTPAVGTDVFVIGTPLDEALANSVTRGVLSGHRDIEGLRLLQTDASVNPGSSGGPILDSRASLIGVVSQKIVGDAVEGIAFGVPVDVATGKLAVEFE